MRLYFTRCGIKRLYVAAPTADRAKEIAEGLIGVPSRRVSVSLIDDDFTFDEGALKAIGSLFRLPG